MNSTFSSLGSGRGGDKGVVPDVPLLVCDRLGVVNGWMMLVDVGLCMDMYG